MKQFSQYSSAKAFFSFLFMQVVVLLASSVMLLFVGYYVPRTSSVFQISSIFVIELIGILFLSLFSLFLMKKTNVTKSYLKQSFTLLKIKTIKKEVLLTSGTFILLAISVSSLVMYIVIDVLQMPIELFTLNPVSNLVNPIHSILYTLLSLITATILAPVSEELLFRGIILSNSYKKRNLFYSIFLSTLIFSFLHPFYNYVAIIFLGISTCLLFLKYNDIRVAILVHFFANLGIVILSMFLRLFELVEQPRIIVLELGVNIGILCIGSYLCYLCCKEYKGLLKTLEDKYQDLKRM